MIFINPKKLALLWLVGLAILFTSCPRGGTKVPKATKTKLEDCMPAKVNVTGNYVISGASTTPPKVVNRKAEIALNSFGFSGDAEDIGPEDNLNDLTSIDVTNWKAKLTAIEPDTTGGKKDCWALEFQEKISGTVNCTLTVTGTVCAGPPCTVSNGKWNIKCGTTNNGGGDWSL